MLNFMHIVKHNKKCIGMNEAAFKLLSSEKSIVWYSSLFSTDPYVPQRVKSEITVTALKRDHFIEVRGFSAEKED